MGIGTILALAGAALFAALLLALLGLYIHDRWISKDNILRNFPVLGRFRRVLIDLGPKLRQYIIADNNEELPFNRDERDSGHAAPWYGRHNARCGRGRRDTRRTTEKAAPAHAVRRNPRAARGSRCVQPRAIRARVKAAGRSSNKEVSANVDTCPERNFSYSASSASRSSMRKRMPLSPA